MRQPSADTVDCDSPLFCPSLRENDFSISLRALHTFVLALMRHLIVARGSEATDKPVCCNVLLARRHFCEHCADDIR